jgi:hypothetical protein
MDPYKWQTTRMYDNDDDDDDDEDTKMRIKGVRKRERKGTSKASINTNRIESVFHRRTDIGIIIRILSSIIHHLSHSGCSVLGRHDVSDAYRRLSLTQPNATQHNPQTSLLQLLLELFYICDLDTHHCTIILSHRQI